MKNTMNEILEQYENKEETKSVSMDTWSEADYELWQYLCGDKGIHHLYNYYDLKDAEDKNLQMDSI